MRAVRDGDRFAGVLGGDRIGRSILGRAWSLLADAKIMHSRPVQTTRPCHVDPRDQIGSNRIDSDGPFLFVDPERVVRSTVLATLVVFAVVERPIVPSSSTSREMIT